MSYLKRRLAKRLNDPEFRQEWKDSEIEYLIARNIIKMRKQRNLTQTELAEMMETKQSVVSRIENGNQNLSVDTLKVIANIFGVNVVDFFRPSPEVKELEGVN